MDTSSTMPDKNVSKNMIQVRVLIIISIILIFVVIGIMWKKKRYSKPDCSTGTRQYQGACRELSEMCSNSSPSSNYQCMNAVAHCMPVVNDLITSHPYGISGISDLANSSIDPKQLSSCTNAITHINPTNMVNIIQSNAPKSMGCLPLIAQPIKNNRMVSEYVNTLAKMTPYALKVAKQMPNCPSDPPPDVQPEQPLDEGARVYSRQPENFNGKRWWGRYHPHPNHHHHHHHKV